MVGNDVQEDLSAGELGIETYLITEYMIKRENAEIICTNKGNYLEFHDFVQKLKPL